MKALRWFRNLTLIAILGVVPCASFAQISVGISIPTAPPELPIYEQPICPAANYIWTPGYWAWGPGGYYWVPGTWVLAPAVGLLWTPGYWGWGSSAYLWHAGYWGPTVGFYGGVNYGYGYGGNGFYGGRWNGGYFSYNTAVMRVNTTIIRNTYIDRRVIVNNNANRVSFNGGRGGIQARPTAVQMQAERQRRMGPVTAQNNQERFARDNKANWASENHGNPRYAALQRPATSTAEFNRAVPAHGYKPGSETRPAAGTRPGTRPTENTRPGTRPTPGNRPAGETRPATRPATPAARPTTRPEARPASRSESRPAARPETRPETRPAARPETRPAARHETRPTPQSAARPAARPAPTPRPAARPESRPAPTPRPAAARPEARPAQQQRPQARPESRPAPQSKPEQEKKPQ
jgi:hypothetical protein